MGRRAFSADVKMPLLKPAGGGADPVPKVVPPDSLPGKPLKSSLPPVSFTRLYSYATSWDKAGIVVACICGAAGGAILPLFSIIFGTALNALADPTNDIVSLVSGLSLLFLYIAIAAGVLAYGEQFFISYSTENQLARLRAAYTRSLLRLPAEWFDTHNGGECVTRLTEASATVQTGLDKLATVVRYTATLITGLTIGFITSWKLALVITACAPLFAIALGILIFTAISSEKAERSAYARAGDIANEVFSLIRAVSAFSGEAHESARYAKQLRFAQAAGIRKGVGIGVAVGGMLIVFYSIYGIATWAGAVFIMQSRDADVACRAYTNLPSSCFTGGNVITTLVSVLIGALSLGQLGPQIGAISAARAAAADLYAVIDTVPVIAVAKKTGHTPTASQMAGAGVNIEFRKATFAYPSRPTEPVLKDFSLFIKAGERIGVVGPSGCGKSTLLQLVLRAYDVQSGTVLVDGVDVRDWHLPSLREMIGVVSQDAVLFSASLFDNIAMGRSRGTVSQEEVEAAAKAANAHDFIAALPTGYNTLAGPSVSSSLLSGGQRKRVCIARALVRSPPLMMLDEATSSLDTTSERLVQAALDTAALSGNKTMIAIAHRISTVMNLDRIIVMADGAIVEEGPPAELASRAGGVFKSMRDAQEVGDPGVHAGTVALNASTRDASRSTALSASPSHATTTTASAASPDAIAPANLRRRLWALQREDWWVFCFAVLGALISGAVQPMTSIVYGNVIGVFYAPYPTDIAHNALIYLGYFFLLGFAAFVGVFSRSSIFTYLGERLTYKLRAATFTAILRQPASFFDAPENGVGRLTTRLATDAALVKGASGESLGSQVEGLGAIIAAMGIAFAASWRLALVLLAVLPLLIIGALWEFRAVAMQGRGGGGNPGLEGGHRDPHRRRVWAGAADDFRV